MAISTPFPGNSVLKECDKISRGKDITSEVLVNKKGIEIHNNVHPVKSALSSMEINLLLNFNHQLFYHLMTQIIYGKHRGAFGIALTTDPIGQASRKLLICHQLTSTLLKRNAFVQLFYLFKNRRNH